MVPVQALIFRRTRKEVPLRRTAAALDEIRPLQKRIGRACSVAPPVGIGRALDAEPAATFAVQRAPSTADPSLGQTPTTGLEGRAEDRRTVYSSVNQTLHIFRGKEDIEKP